MRTHRVRDGMARGYTLIFGYLGIFLMFIGIVCLIPLIMIPFYPSEGGSFLAFLIPGLFSMFVGLGLSFLIFRKEKAQLGKFQDAVLLVSIWLSAIIIGSVPFMFRGLVVSSTGISFDASKSMNFSDAIFESTSGYSSSGLTVFDFSHELPAFHLFTFYRSLLLLVGGIGLVLVVTSAISDRYGLKLYTAEGHNDKLMPNLAKSARLILLIYLGYIVVGAVSYWLLGGMTVFDSINHAIAAVATGGFSTRAGGLPEIINAGLPNSLGVAPRSAVINITSIILMILGSTNFVLHLFLFKGKVKAVAKDCEIRFFGILAVIFIPLFFFAIWSTNYINAGQLAEITFTPSQAFSEGAFLFFSSITTTGFSCFIPFKQLGEAAIILSIVMMCICGGMGSTAGAIKQYRFIIALKSFYWSIRDRLAPSNKLYPHNIYRLGKHREVDKDEVYEAYGYIVIYIAVLLVGTIIITILGRGEFSASDALFEFASALSGTGLSVGVTSLGFENSIAINWTLVFGMFVGRLEIIAVYFAVFRLIRDILRKETI